ncbi:6644_t:CDS:2, partial [Gigaspora rosea]
MTTTTSVSVIFLIDSSNKTNNNKTIKPTTILTEHEKDQLAGYCINVQKLGF